MRFRIFKPGITLACAMASAHPQWLNYPAPGTPPTRDGKLNLPARAPRLRNGKPDLSGVWQIEPSPAGEIDRISGGLGTPVNPFPSWMGCSTGKWEGHTLVVDTAGFNDINRLDGFGHPQSEDQRVQERLHGRDFGHLDLQTTVEDPKNLTKPVTIKYTELLIPNSDVLETFRTESERDRAHMPAAIP